MTRIKDIKDKLRFELTPCMESLGFCFRDDAWYSQTPEVVKIVHVQHFNTDQARFFKTNTATFNLNQGIFYKFIAGRAPSHLLPKEYECHIRRSLLRDFVQIPPSLELNEPDKHRNDIWYIDEKVPLDLIIEGVKKVVSNNGMQWFEQFSDLEFAMDFIKSTSDGDDCSGESLGLGVQNSPLRKRYLAAFVEYINNREGK